MKEKLLKLKIQTFSDGGQDEPKTDPTTETLLKELEEVKNSSVHRDEYDKLVADNDKLIKAIAENRSIVEKQEKKDPTKAEIVERCKERTKLVGTGSQYQEIKRLTENYRDMQTLGMDMSAVDENVVAGLEELLIESKGDETYFDSLCQSRIKSTPTR